MSEHDSNALLAEILRRIDAGEQVDIESICASHPDIADELRSYVDGDALLADMAADDLEGDTSQPGVHDETVRPRGQAGPAIDMSGQTFGRYEINRQIDQGAMGAVYLARDTQLDRDVALKIPKVELAGREEFLKRFKREAQSAANLNHPGICPVFDFGEQDGLPFITMAYIEGEPLSRFVGRKQVDNQWVADTVRKIADALAHAHEQGVVHRDLKSGNVLVNRGGEPIVTDFGLAVRVDQDDETRITQVGALVGTPAYMSPEQIEGESSVIGPPSDVYALGVILYELLAGELPFRGSMGSLIAQITRDDPKSPIRHNPDADPGLCELCLKMMSKRASQRPESMAAVAKLLSDLVIGASKPKPIDDKTKKKLAKLEAGKARVADLVQRGQFAQAVSILEKMAAVKDKDSAEYASWAKAEVKRIKAMPKKLRDGAPQLLIAAKKLMAKHDYGQAAQLLQQVPADMRSPELAQVLHDAIELQDEADLLLTDLHDCVATRTYDGIEDNVQRLLELKPGNKFARELWEALETYQKIPRAQRTYRFASDGTLQPREEGLSKGLLASIGVAVVAFAAMAIAMKGYLAEESPEAGKITVKEPTAEPADETSDGQQASNATEVSASSVALPNNAVPFPSDGNFGDAEPLTELNRTATFRLVTQVSEDGKRIYFTSKSAAEEASCWEATRPNTDSPFAAPVRIFDGTLCAVSSDGLEVIGVKYPDVSQPEGKHEIYYGTRQRVGESFRDIEKLTTPLTRPMWISWSEDDSHVFAIEMFKDNGSTRLVVAPSSSEGIRWPSRQELKLDNAPEEFMSIVPPISATGTRRVVFSYTSNDMQENIPYLASGLLNLSVGTIDAVDRIQLDGHRLSANTGAYCSATGELFFTKMINPQRGSGDRAEIWVARPQASSDIDWTNLFNGRDFTGWQQYDGSRVGKGWDVRSGEMRITGDGDDIVTKQEYENFELEFEWRMPEGGNSGVFYRVDSSLGDPRESGVEYQLFDNPSHSAWGDPIKRSGAIYNLYGKIVPLRPRDEFNQSRIIANGGKLTHYLNGNKVAEATIGTPEWNRLSLAAKNDRFPQFAKSTRGRIAIQSYGAETIFRNMRIREIETQQQASAWTDLLSRVSRPAIDTGWERLSSGELAFDGSRLVYDKARGTRLMSLPFDHEVSFPYELEIAGIATDDLSQLATTLPVANGFTAFVLMTERENYPGNFGGLEMINGLSFKDNPQHVTTPILASGQFDLRFVVDSDADVTSVSVWNGDQQVFTWSGPTSSLSLDNQWVHGKANQVGIGAIGPDKGRATEGTLTKVRVREAPATATGWTNLLARPQIADLHEDWSLEPSGTLKYDAAGNGVQTIFAPTLPAAYEVEVDFTTNDDINQLGLTLPIANGLCQFMLFKNGPSPGGVEFIDGKQFQQAAVQVSSQQLGNVSRNLRVSVESTPQTTTIIAHCDDVEVFRWSGDTDRLSLTNHWDHGQRGKLAIATGTAPASRRAGRKGYCEIKTMRWRRADSSVTKTASPPEPAGPQPPPTRESASAPPIETLKLRLTSIDSVDLRVTEAGIDLLDKSDVAPMRGKRPVIEINGKSWDLGAGGHISFRDVPNFDASQFDINRVFVQSAKWKQGIFDYDYINEGLGISMLDVYSGSSYEFEIASPTGILPVDQRQPRWSSDKWYAEFRNVERPLVNRRDVGRMPDLEKSLTNRVEARRSFERLQYDWDTWYFELANPAPAALKRVDTNHLAVATRELVTEGGEYLVRVLADNGVIVEIGENTVIDHWKRGKARIHEARVSLAPGTYPVNVKHCSIIGQDISVLLGVHIERLSK